MADINRETQLVVEFIASNATVRQHVHSHFEQVLTAAKAELRRVVDENDPNGFDGWSHTVRTMGAWLSQYVITLCSIGLGDKRTGLHADLMFAALGKVQWEKIADSMYRERNFSWKR